MVEKNKNYLIVAMLSLLIILVCGSAYFLLQKRSSLQNVSVTKKIEKSSFPLNTNVDSGELYIFRCQVENIDNTDLEYKFEGDNLLPLTIRLLARCSYLDVDNNRQELWTILGSLMEDESGIYFAYGSRAWPLPIDNKNFATGEYLKEKIEEYAQEVKKFPEDSSLGEKDILKVVSIHPLKSLDQSINESTFGFSERVYYNSGLTKVWSSENFENFISTGNPEYLPKLPNGDPFIPAIRVEYESNSD